MLHPLYQLSVRQGANRLHNLLPVASIRHGVDNQLAQIAFQQFTNHIEHAVGAHLLADAFQLFQQGCQHLALACVVRHEVIDMHLARLPIAMDAPHALLQAVRVPRNVVVDHQRAELQVNALAPRLGGDHHLRLVAKLMFRLNARVEVHAAV